MATIQIDVPEEDRERFAKQAKREGKTLEAWLISVARQYAPEWSTAKPFESLEELHDFWRWCDTLHDGEREPDWEEHLRIIDLSKRQGLPVI